jgi:hypothetical protein
LLVYRWIAGQLHQRHLLGPALVTLSTTLASVHPWRSDHPLAGLLANIYRISFCLWPRAFLIGRPPGDSHSLKTLNAAHLVRDNQRLTAKLEEQLGEVQASCRQATPSGAVERDLHDGAQQRLVAVVLGLRMAQQRLGSDVDPTISVLLSTTAKERLAAVAELCEHVAGIRPAVLTEAGPVAAVRTLLERTPIPVHFPAAEIPVWTFRGSPLPTSW